MYDIVLARCLRHQANMQAAQPNSIRAEPGDIVMFQFYPTNHSVIKAAYGYPCIPYEDLGLDGGTFFSGFFPVAEITDQVCPVSLGNHGAIDINQHPSLPRGI